MKYTFIAHGHPNVTSRHRTTLEVTRDREIGKSADCIIGVSSDAILEDFPGKLKEAIKDEKTVVKIILKTENSQDEVTGYGHPELTLDHPTDIVCRKSEFKCSRTLMIKANKAACDLKEELIDDLKVAKDLKVEIVIDSNNV